MVQVLKEKKLRTDRKNPILESVAEVKRLEFNAEVVIAYDRVKKALGKNFDLRMSEIAQDIVSLQKQCKSGTSFFLAGLILTTPPDEPLDDLDIDFDEHVMLIKAAIGWGIQKGLNKIFYEQQKEE